MSEIDVALDGTVTPEQAIELLSLIKKETKGLSVILGINNINGIEGFLVVEKGIESEMQGEMLIAQSFNKTIILDLLDLTVNQYKEILKLANINPSDVIGNVNEFANSVKDMAIDTGAIFSDDEGYLITVGSLEDKRKLVEFINGNNDDGIYITFNATKSESKLDGCSYSLTEVRKLIESKSLCALF